MRILVSVYFACKRKGTIGMSDLLYETQDKVGLLTMNRISKHNAFDNQLLTEMRVRLDSAINDTNVRVIVLKANGKHFSAGADLTWMQSMANFTEEENLEDSMVLGNLMYSLSQSPKPTIAMVQGAAFGGGAGLAAACDIAIASTSARFCFSEVKLGLIPAVISPYVVRAIGERAAKMLFMSAEVFDATRAYSLNLVQHCVPDDTLLEFTLKYASQISNNAPEAVKNSKQLAQYVANKKIDQELVHYTASLIAHKRVSDEGQEGLKAFLNKEIPNWNKGSGHV
ncbi:TPA: gamma-carboxygeranoyl-CoA hydratase [Legionella pneumophila]|nr:gamma-carboxygeranoyl-CoA hydratase [Legionella pneumophila]HAT9121747.1 gamma-carboxygeranoyl-CoA hydratase [Legionella pneumophila subsp. pneumophila]HAT6308603.1 gamma-carboxygeranoyl-CoA hydratase [Legionella pneumophila]HAT9175628.1 gamma-carboxygeranoyl-CoA hydratase [Legionella pneumophila subsp. pneumophila]HAT9219948.1 gamma-carboxygeranoyl-CoA hydratase [Legionella pneumophila subsp. pneumophila]